MTNNKVTIIGIAGGTGSGKTTVVKKIVEALPPHHVAVVTFVRVAVNKYAYVHNVAQLLVDESHDALYNNHVVWLYMYRFLLTGACDV